MAFDKKLQGAATSWQAAVSMLIKSGFPFSVKLI